MMSILTSPNSVSLRLVADAESIKDSQVSLHELTSRMRDGSDEAWHEFHQRYYLPLLRYAASRNASFDDAGDIIQQAYLRVARHIKPFHDQAAFWHWLVCVVRCAAVDHQRGIRRRAILLEKFAHWCAAQKSESSGVPDARAAKYLAQEALEKLPIEDAQLLRLKYYEGWSVQEIATDANTTPKAIENRLARLRQQLRETILRSL
jgi:RNA polymerase sigma factor (sigma-70 family)